MKQSSLISLGQDVPDLKHLTARQEFTVTNKRGIPFTGEVYGRIISFHDLIFSPIPQLKCITCGFYGRTFYCQPKLPTYYSWKEKLSKYNFFLLIIGRINVTLRYKNNLENFSHHSEWKSHYYAGNEGTNILKRRVRQRRIQTINYLLSFTKVRFCEEGGGCKRCKVCGFLKNEKCAHPEYSSAAPEAMGIDSYSMLPELEIPPINNYHIISMVYANLNSNLNPSPLTPRTNNHELIKNISNLKTVYPVKEIWNPEKAKERCKKCKFYSPFLCDRRHYLEEDLFNIIKNWNLYVIRLSDKINTTKAIKELHNYQLWFHRQGKWQSFQLLPIRCPICKECTIEVHKDGAYKKVQNRAIPFCVSYFNLNPPEKSENIGYIMG